MESFSLLKYWRGGTGSTLASKPLPAPEPEPEPDDEGPFFDLEFTVPEDHVFKNRGKVQDEEHDQSEDGEDEKEFNFSMTSSEGSDLPTILSPSDDLFFKGRLVPLESSSIVIAGAENDPKTQLAVSLLKSATRFRVFTLGLRKPKCTAAERNATSKQNQQPNKFFFIKFKVEEAPIVSLFTRESSSRNPSVEDTTVAASEEKKSNSKEVVQKYLSKIKPLYIRVSKRYADKLRFSGPLVEAAELSCEEEKEAGVEEPAALKIVGKNLKLAMPARLRVAYERLGKSRLASSAVAAVCSPPQRRDDSLLQQQDGIQSAIAHCKRSFTVTSEGAKENCLELLPSP